MGNYEDLKSSIREIIRTNGNNEITGELLQQTLLSIVSSLGDGYLFKGVAGPNTQPGTPDQNVFYLTEKPGMYVNFGFEVTNLSILWYNGTWHMRKTEMPFGQYYAGYIMCDSAASDPIKKIIIPNFINNEGARFIVKFVNGNTANDVYLQVNDLEPKIFFYNGFVVSQDNTWSSSERMDVFMEGNSYAAKTYAWIVDELREGRQFVPTASAVLKALYNIPNRQLVESNIPDLRLNVRDDMVILQTDDKTQFGLSLRTIFEDNNVLGIEPNFNNGTILPLSIFSGNPKLTTAQPYHSKYSLDVTGNSSQQIVTSGYFIGEYYVAISVKIDRMSNGGVGIMFGSGSRYLQQEVTDWTHLGGILTAENQRIFIGSTNYPDLDGYVASPVVVPTSIFGEEKPTAEEFMELYNQYLNMLDGSLNVVLTGQDYIMYSDEEAKASFIEYMNNKAAFIGANTAHFSDASGLIYDASTKASARDILQILIHAAGIPNISEKWNKKNYTFKVLGSDSVRTENIISSVQNSNYDISQYPILGGKTGTLTTFDFYNLMFCVSISGREYAIVLMGASSDTNRWLDAEKIVQHIERLNNGESSVLNVTAQCVAACELPANPIMYDNFPFELIVDKAATSTIVLPASLTKIMTLIAAYDYIVNENDYITIVSSDIIGGSGNNLQNGDRLTIRDIIYDMLLPSSNSAAVALSRYVGNKILQQ